MLGSVTSADGRLMSNLRAAAISAGSVTRSRRITGESMSSSACRGLPDLYWRAPIDTSRCPSRMRSCGATNFKRSRIATMWKSGMASPALIRIMPPGSRALLSQNLSYSFSHQRRRCRSTSPRSLCIGDGVRCSHHALSIETGPAIAYPAAGCSERWADPADATV